MQHEEKIKLVCNQIKQRLGGLQPVKILKREVSHFVPNPYDRRGKLPKIDISTLNEIISIDAANRLCVTEPGVTFSELVTRTLEQKLIPCTVPELKTITIGGAISGCSVESMSYKYGGFHDGCVEYEVITGRGVVITCTPERNADIFHMVHGSYGTLGIITKISFKLLPAKPYVKMQYVKFDNFPAYWNFLKERCLAADHDFVDSIIHGPDKLVVCLGDMIDAVPYTSSYNWLKIFYKSTLEHEVDYLTTYDYFFRYDTECHWLTKTVPLLETVPARFLLGKMLLGSTNLIKWSKRLAPVMRLKRRPEVVVDVFIPEGRFEEFFRWYEREFSFYPLWIVPYKIPSLYPWIDGKYAQGMGTGFFIDCAVYGKKNNEPDRDYSKILEDKTIELNGIKTLISRNHFSEETFWSVYNKENYDNVKRDVDPDNLFNDLYTKFHPSGCAE